MKFPNHISLDFKNSLLINSHKYWVLSYFKNINNYLVFSENFYFNKTFFLVKKNLLLNDLIKNQKKFTVIFLYSNFSKKIYKSKKNILLSKSTFKNLLISDTSYNSNSKFSILKALSSPFQNKTNKIWSLFNINFLKKERMYTKLKYSRTPQYDIVSGGTAAIFAGFLGFLICEKFGFELIDSGDFYFLFMYVVFFSFFGRIFFKLMNQLKSSWSIISLKWLFLFYQNLVVLLIKFFRSFF